MGNSYIVLQLSQHGKYISFLFQVVAPVRETCAQALGVTVQHLAPGSVAAVVRVLLQLQGPRQWCVRHGGLLGLKYVLAVRQVGDQLGRGRYIRYIRFAVPKRMAT